MFQHPRSAFKAVSIAADPAGIDSKRTLERFPLPEAAITAGMLAATLCLAYLFGLPFSLPGERALTGMGFHYLLPVATLIIWGGVILLTRKSGLLFYYAAAFVCYLVVMICHFNVKLWMRIVNPALWDPIYWQIDEALRPLIGLCFQIRAVIAAYAGNIDTFYLFGFVAMFYLSFIVHAVRSPLVFRRLVVASFLVHALGALSYLAAPALGPFLYEAGANEFASGSQAGMLEAHRQIVQGGASWLALNGSANLSAGLAAMPSLHTAAAAVFLYFAWRYERWLAVPYLPIFLFILVEAVASRWHYVIDLPAGLALAALCIAAAHRLYPEERRQRVPSRFAPDRVPISASIGGKPRKLFGPAT